MKHLLLTISLVTSVLFFATTTQAARPCKTIVEACLSAGVIQKGASRQMMIENCVKPVVAGKNVPGVNIDSSIIEACKSKMSTRKNEG